MNCTMKINQQFFHLNWSRLADSLISIIWQLLITTLIFYLIFRWGKKLINRHLNKKKSGQSKRTRTIASLINSIFQYTVIFFYLFGILSLIGVPIGTLLASAGIFSLALGMGAQGFVSDLVNGFFILSEDQFDVGDLVQINKQLGTIIQLGLRTTRIRGVDGAIIYIPNRNITMVKNLGHDSINLNIQLNLAAENDFKQVAVLIQAINRQTQTADQQKMITSEPKIIGLTDLSGSNATFTVLFKIKPGKENEVRNLYLSRYLSAFKAHKIKLGANQTDIK